MKKKAACGASRSKIAPLKDRCIAIHGRIVRLQRMIERVEKKSRNNPVWQELLSSVILGMNEALRDLEKRLDHIETELNEYL